MPFFSFGKFLKYLWLKESKRGVIPVLLSRHASAPFFVIRVALFLSSQCVTLGSNFLCKITIFI
ncbi:MAG: hypothetical protein ACEY3B_03935, partial [Wolbachia sp.]